MKTINENSTIFKAINEIFRDNHIKPSKTYVVDFTESEAVFSNEFGKVTVSSSQKFIFDNLKAEFPIVNLKNDFFDTNFYRDISQAIAIENNVKTAVRGINSQVFIINKIEGKVRQFGLGNIVITNPEFVNTLALFSVFGVNQAFTEKQACSLVCEAFAGAQGENLLDDAVVEQLRTHIHNIKEIYKTGFILTERIN